MPLYSKQLETMKNTTQPCVVFLHGLLGSTKDWSSIAAKVAKTHPVLLIDLPGHGNSQSTLLDHNEGFEQSCQLIVEQLEKSPYQTFILVGYSLGGRLAMYLHAMYSLPSSIEVKGLCIEGGNFGLVSEEEKQLRLENDIQWAKRFEELPIVDVLDNWYQQAVFSSLNPEQRQVLVTKRSDNLGPAIGMMLRSTSLAKQPYLLDALHRSTIPILYICGEADKKFQHLAEQSQLTYQIIAQAGHNAHVEQPERFTHVLNTFLQQWT
ncbi:2-succinyl-6-hydroxy-2,4-cyclohexadiene-1-carboxylate synthase [Aliivibrio fischeri]|uniref:2-succinyl-6-hydroxy-2, 4-cyclohexadiene-1-carboxylate synthase n=1 Tax=Aliivibrio fischeri TaxID=668 RepID=UPI001F229161|nr:2-succinyl-6-hydroxy-2,4-cyclohexadiene-1-carboxylate synthase [Aliivibrio fischeri]MCE7566211.1 2-succinyl-6-hydroxy-2,4-cyclohexadiene-1-carboxylate synthase [Aliivibrio fischeri]